MTKEEKELLLKDLCARLSYGVKISKVIKDYISEPKTPKSINVDGCIVIENEPFDDGTPDIDYWYISEIKPYLRPMSSITEEELEEYTDLIIPVGGGKAVIEEEKFVKVEDFYNQHLLDYRGLIPMGLALEALDGMYNIENI